VAKEGDIAFVELEEEEEDEEEDVVVAERECNLSKVDRSPPPILPPLLVGAEEVLFSTFR